jgi:hypothetical protein
VAVASSEASIRIFARERKRKATRFSERSRRGRPLIAGINAIVFSEDAGMGKPLVN